MMNPMEQMRENAAKIAEDTAKPPCDCGPFECGCNNIGDAMSVTAYHEGNRIAAAIRALPLPPAPSSPASPTPSVAALLRNRLAELRNPKTGDFAAAINDPTKARASLIAANAARIEEVEAALRMVEGDHV